MQQELEQALLEAGFALPRESVDKLVRYYDLLISWNRHTNLTALTEPRDYIFKHVLDSLYPARFINVPDPLVDVGTGAGFPGLALKLAYPALPVSLVESAAKKVSFLLHCCAELEADAEIINVRAEDLGRSPRRETFSYAAVRAVAAMSVVSEYCLPLLRTGGLLLALKGPGGDEETDEARAAITTLGGAMREIQHYQLPTGDQRSLIIIEKVGNTPDRYPRRPGIPAKKPL